jgi:hypothetical protein
MMRGMSGPISQSEFLGGFAVITTIALMLRQNPARLDRATVLFLLMIAGGYTAMSVALAALGVGLFFLLAITVAVGGVSYVPAWNRWLSRMATHSRRA